MRLIEIGDRAATLPGLTDASPAVRRGALIALDQMERGALTLDLVSPLFDASDLHLRQAALGGGRPASRMGGIDGRSRSGAGSKTARDLFPPDVLRRQLVAFSRDPEVQAVIGECPGAEGNAAPQPECSCWRSWPWPSSTSGRSPGSSPCARR